jgi:thioredoxin 1
METSMVREIDDMSFDRDTAEGTVLIDFYAPWCGPCQLQGPILDDLATELGDEVRIVKLNVDDNRLTAARFGVASIPYLVLLRDGRPVREFTGLQDARTLRAALRSA